MSPLKCSRFAIIQTGSELWSSTPRILEIEDLIHGDVITTPGCILGGRSRFIAVQKNARGGWSTGAFNVSKQRPQTRFNQILNYFDAVYHVGNPNFQFGGWMQKHVYDSADVGRRF